MKELHHFYNRGFGWICRACEAGAPRESKPSRLMREGEAEGGTAPRLSTAGLAKWTDPSQRVLVCPSCGVSEEVEKA